jgi:non-heme chloroperoxidase
VTSPTPVPVVFVHGLWLHATSWDPWVELFAARGYDPVAPGWPGDAPTAEATRADPDAVAGYGVGDVTDHYSEIISTLPSPPVVIGHSFGGLIAGWAEIAGTALDFLSRNGVGTPSGTTPDLAQS